MCLVDLANCMVLSSGTVKNELTSAGEVKDCEKKLVIIIERCGYLPCEAVVRNPRRRASYRCNGHGFYISETFTRLDRDPPQIPSFLTGGQNGAYVAVQETYVERTRLVMGKGFMV